MPRHALARLPLLLLLAVWALGCESPTAGRDGGGRLAYNDVVERSVAAGDTVQLELPATPPGGQFAVLLQAVAGVAQATLRDSLGVVIARLDATADGRPLGALGTPAVDTRFWRAPFRISVSGSGRFRVQAYVADRAPEIAPRTIAAGDTVSRETLYASNDVDEFTFTGRPGEEYVAFLQVTGPATGRRPSLLVVREGSTAVLTETAAAGPSDDLEAGITGAPLVLTGVTPYTLRVVPANHPFEVAYAGAYRLALLRVDRRPERAPVEVTRAPAIVEEALDHAGDVDEFTLTAAVGAEFNVFFQALDAPVAAPLRLTIEGVSEPGHQPPEIHSDERDAFEFGRSTGRLMLRGTTRATLRVAAVERRARGRYRILVYPVDRRPESAPAHIAPGDSVLDERIAQEGDVDEFTFDVREPTYVNVVTELAPDPAPVVQPLVVRVVRAGQTADDYAAAGGNAVPAGSTEPVRFVTGGTPLPAGRHTIRVSSGDRASASFLGGRYVGGYRLWLRTFAATPETRPAAFAIGERVSESVDPPGDFDEYTTEGRRGDDLQLVARALGAPGSCEGFFFRVWRRDSETWIPTANLVAPAEAPGVARSPRFSLDTAQALRVDVARHIDRGFRDCGAYEFTLVRYPTTPERHRAELVVGEAVDDERLDEPGDVDEFTVRAAPGSLVALEASAGEGILLLHAALLDPDTRRVLMLMEGQVEPFVSPPVRVPASGRLLIRVAEPSYGSPMQWQAAGRYRIRVLAGPDASAGER